MSYPIDQIVSHIKDGKCVLFLGPELLISSNGKYYKAFFEEIADADPGKYKYHHKDNLFSIFGTGVNFSRMLLRDKVSSYYESSGDEIILDLISRIPFSLIVNVSPDNSINKVLAKKGFNFNQSYLNNQKDTNFSNPTTVVPEVYNIFGSIENKQSIILTHEDLFRAIKDLQQPDTIPKRILEKLTYADSFIFLGMKFDTWYYQLLLNILGIEKTTTARICDPHDIDEDIVSVLDSYFQIQFSNNHTLKFIQEIHDYIQTNHQEILKLRSEIDQAMAPKKYVYVSYAWKDSSDANREVFVDMISNRLTQHSVNVLRDRNILQIRDSIESFMHRIGRGKAVMIFITDKYLKSEYCMYEAWQIFKNENHEKKIYIITLPDIVKDGSGAIDIAHYLNYWSQKKEGLEATFKANFQNNYMAANQLIQRVKTIFYIYLFINDFIAKITDTIRISISEADLTDHSSIISKLDDFTDTQIYATLLNE